MLAQKKTFIVIDKHTKPLVLTLTIFGNVAVAAEPASAPRLWIDYWVICNDTHVYLYFTGDNGRVYRSRTKINDFPKGMSDPEICIEGKRFDIFEGNMTYKIKDTGTNGTAVYF